MKTERLYRDDAYMRSAEGTVERVYQKGGKTFVVLDKTVFFPTGGGQSCDTGRMGGYLVTDVFEDAENQVIVHRLSSDSGKEVSPEALADCGISEGKTVTMEIDWDRRFDNMQRHCGEHILTGMFYSLFQGENRGFHMGEDYMTIDISLKGSTFDAVTWDMAKQAELAANKAVWANLPVTTLHFDTKKEASAAKVRKPVSVEKDITVVCVGSLDNPADAVACCGTHPHTSGQVGMIKIYKVESNKGMFRIYFEAGRRAFENYQTQLDALTALSNDLSAGFEDVVDKYRVQSEKNGRAKGRLSRLTKAVIEREAAGIEGQLRGGAYEGGGAVSDGLHIGKHPVRRYEILDVEDLASLGRKISPAAKDVVFLVHDPTNTVFLVSDGKIDCSKLIRENASIYGGKGGGTPTVARAIFKELDLTEAFMDLVEKHLR